MLDHLGLVMQIPLINKSIMILVYKVCNVPLLHPQLGNSIQYNTETNYFTVTSIDEYGWWCDNVSCE